MSNVMVLGKCANGRHWYVYIVYYVISNMKRRGKKLKKTETYRVVLNFGFSFVESAYPKQQITLLHGYTFFDLLSAY